MKTDHTTLTRTKLYLAKGGLATGVVSTGRARCAGTFLAQKSARREMQDFVAGFRHLDGFSAHEIPTTRVEEDVGKTSLKFRSAAPPAQFVGAFSVHGREFTLWCDRHGA